jgi:hypothetical protein
MYPFYNPKFVKFVHEERMAELHAATLRTRPSRRLAWLPRRPLTAFARFYKKPLKVATTRRSSTSAAR